METMTPMETSKKLNWIVAILGIWQILVPFLLDYSDIRPALWNAVVVGIALFILAISSARTTSPSTAAGLDWTNAGIGVWLILAPFILRYANIEQAVWNAIIVGLAVVILETWAALSVRRRYPVRT